MSPIICGSRRNPVIGKSYILDYLRLLKEDLILFWTRWRLAELGYELTDSVN